jgi:hypothetical protein
LRRVRELYCQTSNLNIFLLTPFIVADNGNRQRSPHFKPKRVAERVHFAS